MNQKTVPFANLILAFWLVITLSAAAVTLLTPGQTVSPHSDIMKQASELSATCMEEIKNYKIEHRSGLSPDDKLQTGMIGLEEITSITTTNGILESKRTSTNPNWAAVYISMYDRAGLSEGDSVLFIFSGSFPALNLMAMVSAQVYGLKPYVMAGIGASNYGANDPEFTFFDMAEHLYKVGLLTHRIDVVSLGGSNDIGEDFLSAEETTEIISRIKASGITYLYEPDYRKNIDARLDLIRENIPDVKFAVNVGGSMVGLGSGNSAIIETGYFSAKRASMGLTSLKNRRNDKMGLLGCMQAIGLPTASMLNIRGLAATYELPYDPSVAPTIGQGNSYFATTYNLTVAYIALSLSVVIAICYIILKKHFAAERKKDERNYILCRR